MNIQPSKNVKCLSNLNGGETGEIIQLRGKPEMHRYFYGKGLALGRNVTLNNAETTSQSLSLNLVSGSAMLERELARNIRVQVI